MAEFDELDSRLRDALGQAANPGDSTGVADAIRSRVAAGDSGTSVASGTAPGWGGGVFSWLPWVGLVVVAGIAGTAVGASGLVGAPVGPPALGPAGVVVGTAPAASCPGGPVIDEFHAGDRVLVVQRSELGEYLGVRDPRDLDAVLWLPTDVLTLDAGQPDPSTLPVGACPEIAISYPTPTPTEEPEPEPEETDDPDPQPPADTTDPTINQMGTSSPWIWGCDDPSDTVTISVVASDNVAVTRVDLTWSGNPGSGSAQMTRNGGQWLFSYTAPHPSSGEVTFVAKARDAAGNVSSTKSVVVDVEDCPI